MIIGTEKAIKILTGIQKYCKDKSWCNGCLLGKDGCNKLFGEGEIPSGWIIDLSVDKTENELIIGSEKALKILTRVQNRHLR